MTRRTSSSEVSPGTNLEQAIFVERMKASFTRELLDRALILTSPANRVADVVIDYQQFGYRRPAAVTGIAAGLAADRLPAVRQFDLPDCLPDRHLELAVRRVRLSLCGREQAGTKLSDQPLRHHSRDRRGEKVALQPDIDQARNGGDGAVGVQGREHQMAGQAPPGSRCAQFRGREFRRS